ncbi:hypothetical protein [Brevundimonas diminuta]|uniref:hypothetical protein n=1 Tax=Brevundimonas diminuta TaxID=293 RepID=UPI0030F7B8A7
MLLAMAWNIPDSVQAQSVSGSAWVAKAAIIEEYTTHPELIFALRSGDFDAVSQLGVTGSPFGVIGTMRQRHYVRAHMATLRYLCRDVNAVAPRSLLEGNVVRFSGRPDRRTGQFRYWIDEGDANADSGVSDAVLLYEELGCPALIDYAGNVARYIGWKWN